MRIGPNHNLLQAEPYFFTGHTHGELVFLRAGPMDREVIDAKSYSTIGHLELPSIVETTARATRSCTLYGPDLIAM